MAWPSVFTYNFCSNPSFEADLTGVTGINGVVPSLNVTTGLYGTQSLQVTLPGQNPNEGVILPPGTVLASATGCVSFSLQGADVDQTGTLNVYVIDMTTAALLGSTAVTFSPASGWTRIVVNGVSFVSGDTIAVYIEAASIQQSSFLVDGIQYEPTLTLNAGALPTPYTDGDQLFGFWAGAQQESASYKLYQNQLSGSGDIQTFGYGSLLNIAAIFYLVNTDPASGPTVASGNIDLSGVQFQGLTGLLSGGGTVVVTGITVLLMFAGLTDFSTFTPVDVDPALVLVGYNNAGVSTGTNTTGSAGYTRPFATFSAPKTFAGSSGTNVWNHGAYFAVGYEFASIAASGAQNITHVQTELVPNNGTPVSPSAYVRPRALSATLAPTRLNYVTNPSFEVSTAGWVTFSSAITRVAGGAVTGSSFSGQVVTSAANGGVYIAVPFLIVGEIYTVSAYVKATTSIASATLSAGSSETVLTLTEGTWQQIVLTFTATASNIVLAMTTSAAGTILIDAIDLEVGGEVNPYGDGGFAGWNWETSTGSGVSRSYYYVRGNIAYAAVQSVLSDHLALGLHAYAPVYNSPPTQYS